MNIELARSHINLARVSVLGVKISLFATSWPWTTCKAVHGLPYRPVHGPLPQTPLWTSPKYSWKKLTKRGLIFQIKASVINRSFNKILLGELHMYVKLRFSQHEVLLFPAKQLVEMIPISKRYLVIFGNMKSIKFFLCIFILWFTVHYPC